MSIHPTAIIDPRAELADDVAVGPYSVIGPDVEIGAGTWIGPHAVIQGPARIGRENQIFQFSSIGEGPQDKKYAGEDTRLEMGDRNTIREYVTINRGTVGGGGLTSIGNDNWLMAYIHIAHDCHVGNETIFSNNASLAGHVTVGDYAILGGFTLIHQFCTVGEYCFTGMGSAISKDVPPYLLVAGHPGKPHGINVEGLKRRGFEPEAIRALRRAYKLLYRSGLALEEAKTEIRKLSQEHAAVGRFADFLEGLERSVIR